jgi:hypothetical protein
MEISRYTIRVCLGNVIKPADSGFLDAHCQGFPGKYLLITLHYQKRVRIIILIAQSGRDIVPFHFQPNGQPVGLQNCL